MEIIIFIFVPLFAFGLFMLLAGFLRLPTVRTAKAMMNTGKQEKSLTKTMDAWILDGAVKLSGILHLNEYRKSRLAHTLKAAGIGMTPEVYQAYAYVKSGGIFLLIIPVLFLFPLLTIVLILLGILVYFKEIRRAEELLKEKKEQIDGELYRFASTVTQELHNSRDVLLILEHYKKSAGELFRQELDIVCADMRSGSYEAALTRFEARLNLPQLSDVVRGLIGVMRGDDGVIYFQMLTHDFKQAELQRLKAKAAKIPSKIRKFSFIMMMCFLLTYLVIIGFEIMKSFTTLF